MFGVSSDVSTLCNRSRRRRLPHPTEDTTEGQLSRHREAQQRERDGRGGLLRFGANPQGHPPEGARGEDPEAVRATRPVAG